MHAQMSRCILQARKQGQVCRSRVQLAEKARGWEGGGQSQESERQKVVSIYAPTANSQVLLTTARCRYSSCRLPRSSQTKSNQINNVLDGSINSNIFPMSGCSSGDGSGWEQPRQKWHQQQQQQQKQQQQQQQKQQQQ